MKKKPREPAMKGRKIIREVHNLVQKHRNGSEISQKAREAIIAVLSDLALAEFLSKKFEDGYSLGIPELCLLPARERQVIVRDISIEIMNCKGTPKMKTLRGIVKSTCPWLSELDVDRIYPASLAVSMPVLAAYTQLFDDRELPCSEESYQSYCQGKPRAHPGHNSAHDRIHSCQGSY
jgi:hypothetical protein